MTALLWHIEGAEGPPKHRSHDDAAQVFDAELERLRALPSGAEQVERADALVLYFCIPIAWAEVTAEGVVERHTAGLRLTGDDCGEQAAEDQRCADGEQAAEQPAPVLP